jgi:hypothetical protein
MTSIELAKPKGAFDANDGAIELVTVPAHGRVFFKQPKLNHRFGARQIRRQQQQR